MNIRNTYETIMQLEQEIMRKMLKDLSLTIYKFGFLELLE